LGLAPQSFRPSKAAATGKIAPSAAAEIRYASLTIFAIRMYGSRILAGSAALVTLTNKSFPKDFFAG
jgi:hypothetical protein